MILKISNYIQSFEERKKYKQLADGQVIQSQTPRTIKSVPKKAKPRWVSSPKSTPNTAVAAKVVALVTGTVSEIGVSLRMEKKVADAERFIKNGTVYCQIERSFDQFRNDIRSRANALMAGSGCGADLRAWSQRIAPRRIIALVAPHTSPTAIIFSLSPTIFFSVPLSPNE